MSRPRRRTSVRPCPTIGSRPHVTHSARSDSRPHRRPAASLRGTERSRARCRHFEPSARRSALPPRAALVTAHSRRTWRPPLADPLSAERRPPSRSQLRAPPPPPSWHIRPQFRRRPPTCHGARAMTSRRVQGRRRALGRVLFSLPFFLPRSFKGEKGDGGTRRVKGKKDNRKKIKTTRRKAEAALTAPAPQCRGLAQA